jgi:O-antigen/teichoic acid export membrane protein
MQKNFIAVAIAFNILFFSFGPVIAYILFWEKYITSWEILRYSVLFLVFNFLLQINFNILAWIWKVKERLKIISLAIVFNAILNIIFIKFIWVYWAALATALGWIFIWILSEIKLGKKYFSNFDYNFLTKNIILMWLLWFILYNFFDLKFFENLWRFYSLIIFSLIWFFLVYSFLNHKLQRI